MEGAVKVWHVGDDGNGEFNGEFVKVGIKVMGFRGGLCVWLKGKLLRKSEVQNRAKFSQSKLEPKILSRRKLETGDWFP
ncbi:hypothetical protein V6N13_051454 [Hibiscus sabdariffa]